MLLSCFRFIVAVNADHCHSVLMHLLTGSQDWHFIQVKLVLRLCLTQLVKHG